MEHINWYPGHMKKTEEQITQYLKLVDVVCELLDARIPNSSRNPNILGRTQAKPRVIVLNKQDLADPEVTKQWREEFLKEADHVLSLNAQSGTGVKSLRATLEHLRDVRNRESARKRPLRLMIVGVPNVGKSSLINRLIGKKGTRTGNKPGVTRGVQWLNLGSDIQLLDTPGVLWPKFDDPKTGLNLAYCGVIKDEVLDLQQLALSLCELLMIHYPRNLIDRYRLSGPEEGSGAPLEVLEEIARNRGHVIAGGRFDYERTARMLLDDFRQGRLGRITLEFPEGF
ncbi:MAG TPA: ribosome biogenesis GTPase YlqF [Clostridiales bacterium]|jgi:ribosome biogenesis GTPase A|nr:ribosome biogenesis GTPase YlqF [Clostridiales bacterium]